jgi:hypothetical protein
MSETAARYRSVAAGFTRRVEGVPQTGWSDPAPCEGWVARDVVRHVVDTSGFFLGMAGPRRHGPPVGGHRPGGGVARRS